MARTAKSTKILPKSRKHLPAFVFEPTPGQPATRIPLAAGTQALDDYIEARSRRAPQGEQRAGRWPLAASSALLLRRHCRAMTRRMGEGRPMRLAGL